MGPVAMVLHDIQCSRSTKDGGIWQLVFHWEDMVPVRMAVENTLESKTQLDVVIYRPQNNIFHVIGVFLQLSHIL